MSAWLTLLKAGLPYLTDIVADRLPVFTKRKEQEKNAAEVIAQQIAELQQAAQHNAESVKALAEQLQQTVKAVETGAIEHERAIAALKEERDVLHQRVRSARGLALIAFGAAFLSLAFAILGYFI